MDIRMLYITAGSRDEAKKIGRALVEGRLAACANVIDGMESVYWWEGKLTEDREAVLIVKTRADLVAAVTARVKALHSYAVPCVVALPIPDGNPDFLAWVATETAARPS
ncbi:MAG TPA: divalent-cation tolerance protein CutA [Alphaproteobacteria bacterium]|nr:divalent-cation tolerance protein CutA [Alphaproteobacteria bacterium]